MRFVRPLVLSILIFSVLAACASPSTAATQAVSSSGTGSSAAPPPLEPGDLSLQTALLVGTLKLEGTPQAVTSEQAAQLLTLWKAVRSLAESDTTSDVEMEALTRQIEASMTADQRQAIEALELTQEDVMALMQELVPGQFFTSDGSSDEAFPEGGPPDGVPFIQGGPPGGAAGAPPDTFFAGPGGDQGASLTPEQLATLQARRESGGGARMNLRLLQPLLDLLEERSKEA
jgi:hypothetical protein